MIGWPFRRRESARALLREIHVDAVRWAEARGVDVWKMWCGRHDDPLSWHNVKGASTVGAALELLIEANRNCARLVELSHDLHR